MKRGTEEARKKCPRCGKIKNQIKAGYNGSGSQCCKRKEHGIYYTIDPKQHAYPEETRELAIKMYYGGVSGCGEGKILGMNKSNGYIGYLNVAFPGKHIFNIHNKNDTFTVEGVNADLRHYIPTLLGGAGVSTESRRISRRSSLSLFMLIIVLDARRTVIVPAILGPLFPFPSLTSFNSPFGHSRSPGSVQNQDFMV